MSIDGSLLCCITDRYRSGLHFFLTLSCWQVTSRNLTRSEKGRLTRKLAQQLQLQLQVYICIPRLGPVYTLQLPLFQLVCADAALMLSQAVCNALAGHLGTPTQHLIILEQCVLNVSLVLQSADKLGRSL